MPFFKPTPIIDHIDDCCVHNFTCNVKTCKGKGKNGQNVGCYLNTVDATSTSNLRYHAKNCWGDETIAAASDTKDVHAAHAVLEKSNLKDGLITAAFQRVGKEKIMYSHRQHTRRVGLMSEQK